MYFARVIGEVVATQKSSGLGQNKLLLIEALDEKGLQTGSVRVAVDTVRAGFSQVVACTSSREAALSLEETFVPVDDAIIGIVDNAGVF